MNNHTPQNDPAYIRLIKSLIPFLLSAGGLATGYSIAQKITSQPLLQFIIAIIAGLLAYTLSFINKVWQKLEGPLVDKTAAWVPSFLNNRFAGYCAHYLSYLSHAHRVLEFNGLSQRPAYNRELDRIFVELEIVPIPPHLASAHPLKETPASPSDAHPIWHYLNHAEPSDPLIILGPAGSGKSTLLKYITFSLSHSRLHAKIRHMHHIHHSFPILLYIREQVQAIKNKPECTLPELVQSHVQDKGHLTIPVPWLERQLQKGKCLVMLDGLDEAPDKEDRKVVMEWVNRQIMAYASNRFILTSRPHGYADAPLDNVATLIIEPFTPPQIKSFITQWYFVDELRRSGKDDPGTHMRASEGANKLLTRLDQKPSLLELAANPLLLTMITILHSTGSSLPDNRLDLYREIFQVLLYRRREAVGLPSKLNVNQKLAVLQPLACYMQQRRTIEIEQNRLNHLIASHLAQVSTTLTPTEFLKDIEQNSSLLLEVSTGTWSFAHKTLQEYLAATYLKDRGKEKILLRHIQEEWWRETICFYCAQANATKLIQTCLAQADTSAQMLTLALECNNQKLGSDATVDQRINELLQTGSDAADSLKRSIVAEVLLKRRLENMVYLRDNVYADTSLVTHAEYQLFLDAQSAQRRYYHPWHWHTNTFQPGQGREPILGVQPLEVQAFCDWLTAHENERWHYRLPHKDELPQIRSYLNKAQGPQHSIGFWIEDQDFAWIDDKVPEYNNLEELVRDQLLLDKAKALSYDRVRARDRRESIDEALEIERTLNNLQVPDMSPFPTHVASVHPLILDILHFLQHAIDSNLYHPNLDLHSSIINNLSLLYDPIYSPFATSPPFTEEKKYIYWLIRYQSQLLARSAYFQMQQTSVAHKQKYSLSRQRSQEQLFTRQELEFAWKVCIDLSLLELRVRGKLPPWEGILLVKERGSIHLP